MSDDSLVVHYFNSLQKYLSIGSPLYFVLKSGLNLSKTLQQNLKYYPTKDVLTGPDPYFEYDEDAIRQFITSLNERKCNIMIPSSKTYKGIIYDRQENWFGTRYTRMKIPVEWISLCGKGQT